jgi:hypothetical protein
VPEVLFRASAVLTGCFLIWAGVYMWFSCVFTGVAGDERVAPLVMQLVDAPCHPRYPSVPSLDQRIVLPHIES